MTKEEKQETVPVKDKVLLTVEEASAYSGIGTSKLREISEGEGCEFVFWNGSKRMFKRKKLEEYIENNWSI